MKKTTHYIIIIALFISAFFLIKAQFSASAMISADLYRNALAVTNTPTPEEVAPTATNIPTNTPEATSIPTNTPEATSIPTNTPEATSTTLTQTAPTATSTSVANVRPRPGGPGNLGIIISVISFGIAAIFGVVILYRLFMKKSQ